MDEGLHSLPNTSGEHVAQEPCKVTAGQGAWLGAIFKEGEQVTRESATHFGVGRELDAVTITPEDQ